MELTPVAVAALKAGRVPASDRRDLLVEARAIVADEPPPGKVLRMLPERAHLIALSEHYCELLHELTHTIRELRAGLESRTHLLAMTRRAVDGEESRP